MEKKMKLINIYLKIHQKRDLTWEELEYLAHFDPECFEKTCKNVVYNLPQAKPVILPKEEKKEVVEEVKEETVAEEKPKKTRKKKAEEVKEETAE